MLLCALIATFFFMHDYNIYGWFAVTLGILKAIFITVQAIIAFIK